MVVRLDTWYPYMFRSYMFNIYQIIWYLDYFFEQVLDFQKSGIKLGVFKSINESITRVAVYVSLMALYILGGNKVQAVSSLSLFCCLILLEVGIWAGRSTVQHGFWLEWVIISTGWSKPAWVDPQTFRVHFLKLFINN